MQCTLPPPSTISRPGTVTTSRSGKAPAMISLRHVVVGVVERRQDDAAVDDEEVEVGRGGLVAGPPRDRALGAVDAPGLVLGDLHDRRHRHGDDLERAALRVGGLAQHAQVVLQELVAPVVLVLGDGGQHDAGPHEAGDVVDVAVGLVGVDALGQPDDLLDVQVVAQVLLDLLARQVRVAAGAEQALLGGDDGALAVHVERAALHDDAAPCSGRRPRAGRPSAAPAGPSPRGSRGRRRGRPRR